MKIIILILIILLILLTLCNKEHFENIDGISRLRVED